MLEGRMGHVVHSQVPGEANKSESVTSDFWRSLTLANNRSWWITPLLGARQRACIECSNLEPRSHAPSTFEARAELALSYLPLFTSRDRCCQRSHRSRLHPRSPTPRVILLFSQLSHPPALPSAVLSDLARRAQRHPVPEPPPWAVTRGV